MPKKNYGFISPFTKRKISDKHKLAISNDAHRRLLFKHLGLMKITEDNHKARQHGVKYRYHQLVWLDQQASNRKLSTEEKKAKYKVAEFEMD